MTFPCWASNTPEILKPRENAAGGTGSRVPLHMQATRNATCRIDMRDRFCYFTSVMLTAIVTRHHHRHHHHGPHQATG
jgi:hypothetical protein